MPSFTESYKYLAVAQKGRGRGAPAYSLYVNRPAGRVLAALANTWGLTPNAVTLASAAATLAALVLLATIQPTLVLGICVWFLLALGYALDSADGQLARLRGGGSLAGEWLDHVIDAWKIVAIPVAVTIGMYRFFNPGHAAWMLVPLWFAMVSTVMFFAMILNDLLRARAGLPQAAEAGGSSLRRSILGLPTDYGVLCLSFVVWGAPPLFIAIYSLLAIAATLHLAAALPVWFRRISQI